MPRDARPEGAGGAVRSRVRLLLVAGGDEAEAWLAGLRDAGLRTRAARAEDLSGVSAALRDPADLVVVWDDPAGRRAGAVTAAVVAAGVPTPVAVVAHPDAEAGLAAALAEGAAAGFQRDRPGRLAAELGRLMERERLLVRIALTGRITHDLNNLLAPIPLASRLLRRASHQEGVDRQLDSLDTASRRSMGAVKDLSELLAGEGEAPLRVQAKHLLTLATRPWRLRGAPSTVLTDYPSDLRAVRVDVVRALQVLWCLARRALDRGAEDREPEDGVLVFSGRNETVATGDPGVELRVEWVAPAGDEGHHGSGRLRAPQPSDRLDVVVETAAELGGTVAVLEPGQGAHGFALLLPSAPEPPREPREGSGEPDRPRALPG